MGIVETQAVVIQTFKLADADKIAVCMTEKAGLIRGVARGARRLKSKFGASLEPFTLIRLTYFEKESRELVTIKGAEIVKSYFGAAGDVEALASLGYLAELVREFAPPNQSDPRLFRMLRACVDALACEPGQNAALLSYCELWVLRLAGFLPDYGVCAGCGRPTGGAQWVDLYITHEGVLHCRACRRTGQAINEDVYRLLCALRASGPRAWSRKYSAVSAGDQQTVSETARRLLRRVLEKEPRPLNLPKAVQASGGPGGS